MPVIDKRSGADRKCLNAVFVKRPVTLKMKRIVAWDVRLFIRSYKEKALSVLKKIPFFFMLSNKDG
jgi:5'(3')-deoxyribonucleotidase